MDQIIHRHDYRAIGARESIIRLRSTISLTQRIQQPTFLHTYKLLLQLAHSLSTLSKHTEETSG